VKVLGLVNAGQRENFCVVGKIRSGREATPAEPGSPPHLQDYLLIDHGMGNWEFRRERKKPRKIKSDLHVATSKKKAIPTKRVSHRLTLFESCALTSDTI
jgi:hypothetical protein